MNKQRVPHLYLGGQCTRCGRPISYGSTEPCPGTLAGTPIDLSVVEVTAIAHEQRDTIREDLAEVKAAAGRPNFDLEWLEKSSGTHTTIETKKLVALLRAVERL